MRLYTIQPLLFRGKAVCPVSPLKICSCRNIRASWISANLVLDVLCHCKPGIRVRIRSQKPCGKAVVVRESDRGSELDCTGRCKPSSTCGLPRAKLICCKGGITIVNGHAWKVASNT